MVYKQFVYICCLLRINTLSYFSVAYNAYTALYYVNFWLLVLNLTQRKAFVLHQLDHVQLGFYHSVAEDSKYTFVLHSSGALGPCAAFPWSFFIWI